MSLLNPVVDAASTKARVEQAIQGNKTDVVGKLFSASLLGCLLASLLILGVLISDVLSQGGGVITDRGMDFITAKMGSDPLTVGVAQGLFGTIWIAIFVIALAFPIGVGSAVYLEEYANKGRLARFIELNIRNLAGVPSVVYGLLGLGIFVRALSGATGGATLISAGLTLAILALPVIIITSAEAIRAVPQPLREGAYGVGATRWTVVRTQVLPYAAPGILTGTLLSLARSVGEAAPLILVGAITGFMSKSPNITDISALDDKFTALPIQITSWVGKPQEEFQAASAAAIIVLLVFVLLLNSIAVVMRHRFEKRR